MTIAVRPASASASAACTADLGLGVEVRGGLVQDHHPRPGEQQPGDGQPLPLAARQPVPALAHHGVQPVRQRVEQVAEPGAAQRVDELGVASPPGAA